MSRVHPKKNVAALVRAYVRVRGEVTSDEWRVASDGTTQGPKDKGTNGLKSGALPDLVVAGPGWDSDYGREVRALIDEANRSIASTEHRTLPTANSACVHAVDMLQGDAKWGALYGCEAFVLPSHQENFGIAVVEALACGKPVLISNQINIWREIAEDGAGMVEEDTEGDVEKLLRQFLDARRAESGDLRAEARSKPRECYLKRFAIGPAVASLSRALKED